MNVSSRLPSPGTDGPLVKLERAGLRRAGRWLVRGVDLSVARGEIVTLIGPNGSGKSTTARMALGIDRPDEGSAKKAPGLRVGYVPQKLSIDWTLPLDVERFMRLTAPLSRDRLEAALAETGTCRAANSSAHCWHAPSPANRICWCWTNRCRALIFPARWRSTT